MSLHERSFGWLRSQVLELYRQRDHARARDLVEEALPFSPNISPL
jgi:hypothetical protein